jgi:hypothetical protein
MAKFFFFKRKGTERKLDEKGNPIPLTQKVNRPKEGGAEGETEEVDEVIPGKFETEQVVYEDNFNLERVIRSHTIRKGHVVVLLDDGHEETHTEPTLKNPAKKGPITKNDIIEQKKRQWVQSEISLEGEDVVKYYEALRAV